MAHPIQVFLQSIRRTALLQESREQSDAQLLERFVGGDGVALEMLVRRHALMVWGVCRRTLTHHDAAEDAFQATFLVLLRKAGSICPREQLANWLYGVAYKTACKARQTIAKRYAREKQVDTMPEQATEPNNDEFGPDLRALLDEELSRLPERYRIAVVLCDVEGNTRHDAAEQLHLPEGTLASRLARGRALLAKRLIKRGLSVSATTLAATGFREAASGAVPAALLSHTVNLVNLVAAGEAVAAGLISTRVSVVVEGVLRAMSVAKQKALGLVFVLATLVLAGGIVTWKALADQQAQPQSAPGQVTDLPALAVPGEVRRFQVEEYAWSVSFSPDGQRIVVGVGQGGVPIHIYDLRTGEEVRGRIGFSSCWSTSFSPDGKYIAVGFGAKPIQILNAQTGEVYRELGGPARNVTFSHDGRLIAAGHADDRVRLWDVAQGRLMRIFPAANGAVHGAAFTPDSKLLLVIDPSRALRLYEVESGKEVRRFVGHTDRVTDVAVSADGQRALSCSLDKTLRLWDLATGTELFCLEHQHGLHGMAFCPDGRRAVSAANQTVHLWDLTTGRELHRFAGHQASVVCVAVSPDGRYALSGSSDRTVRLWRLPDPGTGPRQ
jgi:RNA polymerase sigma factor (sigma-70 family)